MLQILLHIQVRGGNPNATKKKPNYVLSSSFSIKKKIPSFYLCAHTAVMMKGHNKKMHCDFLILSIAITFYYYYFYFWWTKLKEDSARRASNFSPSQCSKAERDSRACAHRDSRSKSSLCTEESGHVTFCCRTKPRPQFESSLHWLVGVRLCRAIWSSSIKPLN